MSETLAGCDICGAERFSYGIVHDGLCDQLRDALAQLTEQQQQTARAKAALVLYGRHASVSCQICLPNEPNPCVCGFTEVLKSQPAETDDEVKKE